MAKADGNEPICHVLGFSSSLKWDNNNKKKVNVEMAEINSTFFCFFFLPSLLVRFETAMWPFSLGRWMESQHTVIPHSDFNTHTHTRWPFVCKKNEENLKPSFNSSFSPAFALFFCLSFSLCPLILTKAPNGPYLTWSKMRQTTT